jgi:hypothetical protein
MSSLIRCEVKGCDTLIVPEGRKRGQYRTMCARHWRLKHEPREQGRKPTTLNQMIRGSRERD